MLDAYTKLLLSEDQIPTHWVNLLGDLPGDPLPPLHPGTMAPAGPDDLTPIFPMALIGQEVSTEPEVEIPEEVREAYKLWRPTPMHRARRLERELQTPAHIYYKYEGVSPAGSHKPNTAVAQAYENAQAGVRKLTTETGAGQWGSALAFACMLFGLECEVFMVGSSYDQKPYRRSMMQTWGATVHDVVIGCVGGGSNFAGLVFPFLRAGTDCRIVAAEPAACPTLTRGIYSYDYGDTVGMTPLMPMYTLGHGFVPPPVHAGGLRYHGDAPILCTLVRSGRIEARAYRQNETFEAAVRFARSEGIIPAPEPAHAIRAVIEEAEQATVAGEERVILFNLCGHGHFDLAAYDAYLAGTLEDPEFGQDELDAALAELPAGAPSIA